MMIKFTQNVSISDSMVFEKVYEPELRIDEEFKTDIVEKGIAIWMTVDGELAGEAYGICPAVLDEEIPDLNYTDLKTIYCYSLTILPQFQGKGLSKILFAYWLGMVNKVYPHVNGHATTETVKKMMAGFGAEYSTEHENWFDSGRTAWFFQI